MIQAIHSGCEAGHHLPEGWADDLATPLTINGLARALMEPPLALSRLLSQLDAPTNVETQANNSSKKGVRRGWCLVKVLGRLSEMVSRLASFLTLPFCYRYKK